MLDQKALKTQVIAARVQNILDKTDIKNSTLFFSLVKELKSMLLYLSVQKDIHPQRRLLHEEKIKKIGFLIKDIGGFELLLIVRDYFLDDSDYEKQVTELWKSLGNW